MATNRTLGGSSAAPRLIDTASIGTQRVALSSRGRTFITVGLISLATGLMLGVLDLQRLGVLLLVLPIPAWLAVRQARSGLRVGHAVTPSRVVVGEQAQVRLVLGNPHSFGTGPLRVTETVPGGRPLRFSVAGVRGRQRRTVAYPLPALRRGRYTVGPTTVMASDPFGLVTADTRSTDVGELIVRPTTVPLASLALPIAWRDGAATLSHSVGSGGSDDASVREYRHGDDLRKIHWRSTARSGAFMVRQEERPWHGESMVLLDHRAMAYPTVPTQPDSLALEWAISAAASIACHLADRGRRVAVVTGDGQVAHDNSGAILDMLADVKPALRADVEPLAAALTGLGRDAAVFAVLAATPRGSLHGLLSRPRMPGSAVALLLRPWTWNGESRDLLAEAAWQSTSDTLRAAGWRVVPAEAGDEIADLWPSLLSARVASAR
ncbi:MAG TPA: DUF58 domain-containing protein [Jatrophihabitans sp.]|nr:DUF58 domain-containing protein [Jatrophihabitans sp.]